MDLLEKAMNIFMDREKLIQATIEEESIILFEKAENLEDKYTKTYTIQMICNAIGDSYDFFCYTHGRHNLFYTNIKSLDKDMSQKFFKWISLYIAINCKQKNKIVQNQLDLSNSYVFDWEEKEEYFYKYFKKLKKNCHSHFQWQFAENMLRDMFGDVKINPIILAYTGNLIYNSHISFITEIEKVKKAYANKNGVKAV